MALSKILPASQEQFAGARNLIINGAMQVAQRGTSFTAGGYSLDHWYVSEAGTCTLTQDTADVPANFKYAAKVVTSASSSFMSLYQPFEAVDYEAFKNKTVTISFYAKVNSTFSGNMFVDMQTGDTADTLLSGTWAGNDPQYITPTTSWARYTANISIGSTNGIRFVVSPLAGQASGAEYSITGIQLEVGETATPFEHRSFQDEITRCKRYYQKSFPYDTAPFNNAGQGGARWDERTAVMPPNSYSTSTYIGAWCHLSVPMRATPTTTQYNTNTSGTSGSYLNDLQNSGVSTSYSITATSHNTEKLHYYVGGISNQGNTFGVNWEADAEL